MHFDVPKFVRSPGCDHGHDEESRNGRDIKINILKAYIWISEWFRVKSAFYRSTGRLQEPPEGVVWPVKAHYFPRRIPVTLRYSEKYPNHSEPFRCPNMAFQYISLYVLTISRLLIMSVITYGTPTKLWYIKTYKLIIKLSS